MARSAQVTDGRRAAATPAGGELEIPGAFLRLSIEVIIAREARLLGSLDEGLTEWMRFAHVRDRKRPACTMQRVRAALLVFGAAEIRQHVLEAPAGIAELTPVIKVFMLAADVQQAVDRARSPQHFPARLDHAPIVELRLRLCRIEPVDLGVGEKLPVAEGDVNPRVTVLAPGLQQENAIATASGQAVGKHAAG